MKAKQIVRTIVDAGMLLALLCLMAYQVTGEALHEWIGIGMTLLLIVHHILNRKWYGAMRKGKYGAYRIVSTAVNTLLLGCIALTAFCGMSSGGVDNLWWTEEGIPLLKSRLSAL